MIGMIILGVIGAIGVGTAHVRGLDTWPRWR